MSPFKRQRNVPAPSAESDRPAMPARRKMLGDAGAFGVGGLALSLAPGGSALALTNANQQGLSGSWFNTEHSGQGLLLEVYPDLNGNGIGVLFGGWFTFSDLVGGVSEQRWYTLHGEMLEGEDEVAVTIYENAGGTFNTTPVTFAEQIGTGVVTFASCSELTLDFSFDSGVSGTTTMIRAMQTVGCNDAGTALDSEFAFSGAWYNPETSGQGLVVEINPAQNYAFLAWYTYAPDGSGPRWFTAQGGFSPGDRTVSLELHVTTGGRFNASDEVTHDPVGTAEMSFGSCNDATFEFEFTAGELAGASGRNVLQRSGPAPGACVFGSSCVVIPEETEGPYPLLDALDDPEILRSDITEGLPGVPLSVVMKLVNVNDGCSPVANSAVYIWHCDKDGVYSGYGQGSGEQFMRGVQVSDASGQVVFQTIYPGWYTGRITHIHFRVYLDEETTGRGVATSQIAFPQDVTEAVYNTSLYAAHGQNTSVTSFSRDNVFSDGVTYQLAEVSGNASIGYVATLIVGIAV